MELTAVEIIELINLKEADLEELRNQQEEDFGLLTLEKYVPTDNSGRAMEGYQAYTSSQPANFFDKVTDAINRAELSIQIKLPEDAKEKETDAASKGELYLFGALSAIDRRLRKRGEPPLRESLAYLMNLRGWLVMRALVYELKGETVFDVLPWDFLHTTWESGINGLLWGANKRLITKAQAKELYQVELKAKETTLIDFFDEENNSIIIDSEFVKEPTKHGIGHCPVYIAAVGSMPTIQTKTFESTIEHRGDSVWARSRNLYDPFNKIVSRTMDLYERSVVGSIIHKSKKGDKALPGDPFKTWQEIKLSTQDEEELEVLPVPKAPPETAVLHSIINTDIQTSTLPYPLAYGGTKQAMSGAALSVLADATKSVYSPRTGVMSQAYTWLCEELLSQFKENGKKMDFSGYDSKEHFFKVGVKPKDIDPAWYVSVTVAPRMPRDMEAEIMMSLAATKSSGPGDIPLLSKRTAREDIMKIRDPSAEENKAMVEMGMALPPILLTQVAAALQKAGKTDLAQDVMMLLNSQGGGQGAAPQGPQGQPPGPPPALVQLVQQLAANPQTAPIAQAIVQAMQQGAGAPQGPPPAGPPQGAPI